ncbi:hypothetical protein EZV62_002225 [Acer yangbiense]|uniref:CCHC-type domain-containing protein n=1 Tax=Acer yangbiense TaxID=1000413 RepID=A0A5C7IYW8_9ROSI|nr:hypothetical protein EZV62_002225 [Acer yangbiense]
MDQDEIARLCASLSIKSTEEKLWSVRDTLKISAGKKLDLCLVGKILSNKRVNREAFRAMMPRIWQASMDIKVVQDNIFLFYYRNQGDRFRILAGGPWCFDNSLLMLEKLSGVGDVNNLAFKMVDFWIQIPNAPLLCMTKEMGTFLGQLIGELVDIDVGATGECFGKYMRLRVSIDVTKPLKRCLRVDLTDKGTETILLLCYEKLPEYCYHCGLLGHSHRECHKRGEGERRDMDQDFEFGSWMRATNPPGQNRGVSQSRVQDDKYVPRNKDFGNKDLIYNRDHIRVENGRSSTPTKISGGQDVEPLPHNTVLGSENGPSVMVEPAVMDNDRDGVCSFRGVDSERVDVERVERAEGIDNGPLVDVPLHGNYGDVNMKFKGVSAVKECTLEPSGFMMVNGFKDSVLVNRNVCINGVEVSPSVSSAVSKKGKWKRWAREGGMRVKGPVEEICSQKKREGVSHELVPFNATKK